MKSYALILLLACSIGYAQQLPKNPNITDAKGRRQGMWTVWLNKNNDETARKDSMVYYRTIEYKDNKPTGEVRDYFRSGKLYWDGFLLSDRPDVEDPSRPSHRWSETGQLTFAAGVANITMHPNVTDSSGLRQGWWTLKIGPSTGLLAQKPEDVAFYRLMEFRDGKPIGVVKDYYTTGTLYQEMTLTRIRIGTNSIIDYIDFEQPFHVYWPDGTENLIAPNRIQCDKLLGQGKYELALPFAERALAATVAKVGKTDFRYQYFLYQLGKIHQNLGSYAKAESFYQEALKAPGSYETQILQSLANLYSWTGNYKKAEGLLLKSLELVENEKGKENYAYAGALNLLGIVYANYDLKKAESCFVESINIEKRVSTDKDPVNGSKLNNLGGVYLRQHKFAIASETLAQAMKANEEDGGKESMVYGLSLSRLASVKKNQLDLASSEKLLLDALEVLRKSSGVNNRFYTEAKISLGETYLIGHEYAKAEPLFIQAKDLHLERIQNFFPKLSESEKEAFYRSVNTDLKKFNAYCILRHPTNAAIAVELYDHQLMTKALLLNSSSKWKQRIRSSGDKKLFALYTEWESNHGLLARWDKDVAAPKNKIDSLETLTNEQEKELSARSEMFASMGDKKKVSWLDVKAKLKPNEAAIEMIRINKFGMTGIVTDSSDIKLTQYPQYGLTDTVYYAALLVTGTSTFPELIIFPNGNELETKYIKLYSNSIRGQAADNESYRQFWKPIADKLKKLYKKKPAGGIQVYFSADGVFNQININTLRNPATGKYVLDEMTVNLVTNTKDLLTPPTQEAYNQLAYLFGYPDYNLSGDLQMIVASNERSIRSGYAGENSGVALADLPGTKTEVENIAGIMNRQGWQPEVLTGDQALEEKLKDCFKPRVLHIATHGYFQPDATKNENPLMRSGLMLAGANQTLAGKTPEAGEDGILTAYEAMSLNLDNTDLVVLSACETGLGEVSNGEGVYGLQRAFKVAGARTVIMSLWNVSDEATSQLMSSFYENWLKGQSKREAFINAQLALRNRYGAPYYWGAFVMVGE
jgi:CHAT domain-containing protein